jgi:hypothetical protein
VSSPQSSFDYLIEQLKQKDALINAQKRRIEFLEGRLAQRAEVTKKDFSKLQPYIESMQKRILQMFHSLNPEIGLTMPELQEEFSLRFPNISITNVPRRVFELVEQKRLWKQNGSDDKMRYYLTLKEEEPVQVVSGVLEQERVSSR